MPYQKTHHPRIVLVAGIILTVITLLASISTFIIMERQAEKLIGKSLQLSLAGHVRLTKSEIETAYDTTVLISKRPFLSDNLELAATIEDDIAARNQLNKVGLSFAQEGVKAVVFYGENGQELTSSGIVSRQSELTVPLNSFPGRVQLIWDGQLLLRSVVEIRKQGRVIGKVMTESRLPGTMAALDDVVSLGETGEFVLCTSLAASLDMLCFPTALNPNAFTAPHLTFDGVQLPMSQALQGETGFIITKDYRDQVVTAAFAPVGNYDLGMVLKMDSSELDAPVWSQLRYVIPLMAALVILALVLLRWLLSPLVLKLTESARHLRQLNTEKDKRVEELVLAHRQKDIIRQETDHTKSQFIATVSHELRTPLTSIKGALGLIQAGVFDHAPEKLQSTIQIAYKNTERLHKLIDNILDLEKLETGAMAFDMHALDLSELLQESVVASADYGSEYGVSVFCSSTEEPLRVNGDQYFLMQVMGNLLSNAVKFSPRGERVEACVVRHEGNIRIVVKDNGCGIPEEARKTIFDKFTQVDSSDQRQKGGSGLGLNITKMIVEEHGGHINFTSEVGKGSTFYVDLPKLTVGDVVKPVLRVLLVDDQAPVVEALSTLITTEGAALGVQVVGTGCSAQEALIQVQNLKPDLVLMDIHTPDINGNEAVENIKRHVPNTKY